MILEKLDLKGKRALVCGASQGIGQASAIALRELGAEVFTLARSKEKLEILEKKFGTNAIVADLENRSDLKEKVSKILDLGSIHILINNTGGPQPGPLLQAKIEDFMAAFERHLFASHFLVQLCLPGMVKASYGRIINIVSTSVKEPIPNLGVSNTVRAAMAGWAKTLSGELPPGITINNVLPGLTATPRLESLKKNMGEKRNVSPDLIEKEWLATIPEGRVATAQELANVIAFLASPAASYVRGVSLAVDGGRTRSI